MRAAAGRVARQHDVPGGHATGESEAVGRNRVVEGGRVRVHRRQPVVHRQHPAVDRHSQLGEHGSVRLERADAVATAVEVHDHGAVLIADPLGRHGAGVDGDHGHPSRTGSMAPRPA